MKKKDQNIEEEPKRVVYKQSEGEAMPELKAPPEADGLFRGVIVETPKENGKKRLFEVVDIEEQENGLIAYCRQVTPKYLNSVILVAGLLGAWFALHYLLSLMGIGY